MMKKILLALGVFMLSCSPGWSKELRVEDAVITSAIVEQMPVDSIESYPADYGKLFCFTRIVGAQEETRVTHVWYYQGDELARVTLPVRSGNWRTYSSKRFLPQWAGQWQVKILNGENEELASIPFSLE